MESCLNRETLIGRLAWNIQISTVTTKALKREEAGRRGSKNDTI